MQRTDAYGGSIENRYRFLDEVVNAVIAAWDNRHVGVHLAPNGAYGALWAVCHPPWLSKLIS